MRRARLREARRAQGPRPWLVCLTMRPGPEPPAESRRPTEVTAQVRSTKESERHDLETAQREASACREAPTSNRLRMKFTSLPSSPGIEAASRPMGSGRHTSKRTMSRGPRRRGQGNTAHQGRYECAKLRHAESAATEDFWWPFASNGREQGVSAPVIAAGRRSDCKPAATRSRRRVTYELSLLDVAAQKRAARSGTNRLRPPISAG